MRIFQRAKKLQVGTLAEGALLGRLEDFQFDLENGDIYGWRIRGGGVFGKTGGLPAEALVLIGRDLALVRGEAAVEWVGGVRTAAEGRAWATTYVGTRVMTRRGAEVGKVEDYVVEAGPSRVVALLLDEGRCVPVGAHAALGKDAVILDDPAAARALPSEAVESSAWWDGVAAILEGRSTPAPAK